MNLESYGLIALFAIMLVKEIGIPIPIPSDLLMIGAGVQLAGGAYGPVALGLGLAAAVLIGGSIQFLLARSAGRAVVYRLLGRLGIGAATLDRAIARLSAGGGRAVFVGLNVPGARAAVIPGAGLARMPFARFAVASVAGSMLFYGWHIALGYLVGPAAGALAERSTGAALVVVIGIAAIGGGGWYWLRRRSRSGAARSWTEGACPACLAITAVRR